MPKEHWDRAFYCEGFILVPVDEIPKKDYTNKDSFMDIPTEEWKWHHFAKYFFTRYNQFAQKSHRWVNYGELKGKIEPSLALRGNILLRKMIDYVFLNQKDYPEWKRISLDLVCGEHYWAERIAEAVRLQELWNSPMASERSVPPEDDEEFEIQWKGMKVKVK